MADRPRTSAVQELDPLIGLTVSGRYRVHALIGQGGMGKVFRAQQIPLGRAVALKVLEASRVDAGFHRRFFQEAAILAKLQSRNTVTIYDYGRDGDLYFIAMELVAGSGLDRVLATEGPLAIPRTLAIAEQICRSLREAHAQGVIHRDLKPGNIVLTRSEDGDELVKVLDFGLAKRLDRTVSEDTETDTVPGSPKYMAPEVIRQQQIDGRTDIYGLGVMLYQMLSGVVPFNRENPMDILVAHLHERPRPLREANPRVQVPPPVERLVMRCLAKTPDERFADVQTLAEALRVLAVELGLSSGPASWSGRPAVGDGGSGVRKSLGQPLRLQAADVTASARPVNRRGSRTAGGALILGVLGAIAIFAAISWGRSDTATPGDPPAKPPAQPQPAAKPATAAPAAADPNAAQGVDMVFAPGEDTEGLPAVKLQVSSEPPGAIIWLRGERVGTTPASFVWRDARAQRGGELMLVLRLKGYKPFTIRHAIDAAQLQLSGTLEPLEAAAAAPAEPNEAAPVLKIKPADQVPNPYQVEQQEQEEEPLEPAPADEEESAQ